MIIKLKKPDPNFKSFVKIVGGMYYAESKIWMEMHIRGIVDNIVQAINRLKK